MLSRNVFLQGVFGFVGKGLDTCVPISDQLVHTVPDGSVNQTVYFRGGNASDELVVVVLVRDGAPTRWFPIGAKSATHVPLRVVEDVEGGSVIELHVAAPASAAGELVIDLGMVEH